MTNTPEPSEPAGETVSTCSRCSQYPPQCRCTTFKPEPGDDAGAVEYSAPTPSETKWLRDLASLIEYSDGEFVRLDYKFVKVLRDVADRADASRSLPLITESKP